MSRGGVILLGAALLGVGVIGYFLGRAGVPPHDRSGLPSPVDSKADPLAVFSTIMLSAAQQAALIATGRAIEQGRKPSEILSPENMVTLRGVVSLLDETARCAEVRARGPRISLDKPIDEVAMKKATEEYLASDPMAGPCSAFNTTILDLASLQVSVEISAKQYRGPTEQEKRGAELARALARRLIDRPEDVRGLIRAAQNVDGQ